MRLVLTEVDGDLSRIIAKSVVPTRPTTVITQHPERLADLQRMGTKLCSGSLEDTSFLVDIFQECDTALIKMPIPCHTRNLRSFQKRTADSIFTALKNSPVKHIVHLSSLGAGRPDKTGPILGSYELERQLNWLNNIHVIHIRSAFFMEDILAHLFFDKNTGCLFGPLGTDIPVPLISAADVAEQVTILLLHPAFTGQSIEHILGPKEYTMVEVTKIISEAAGIPNLTYRQISADGAQILYSKRGMSPDWCSSWISCFHHMNVEDKLFGTLENVVYTVTNLEEDVKSLKTEIKYLFNR